LKQELPGNLNTSRLLTRSEGADNEIRLLHTFTAELKDALPVPSVGLSAPAIADFKRDQRERERFKIELDTELYAAAKEDPVIRASM